MAVVEAVTARHTYGLRRQVLRDGDPSSDVVFPEDDRPGAFHLAVWEDGEIVGVGSFSPEGAPAPAGPIRQGLRGARLRGMAVRQDRQGHGFGRLLLDDAEDRLRAEGFEVLWANGRDSAQGFYERLGFDVVGDGFLAGPAGDTPHHVVVLDL